MSEILEAKIDAQGELIKSLSEQLENLKLTVAEISVSGTSLKPVSKPKVKYLGRSLKVGSTEYHTAYRLVRIPNKDTGILEQIDLSTIDEPALKKIQKDYPDYFTEVGK